MDDPAPTLAAFLQENDLELLTERLTDKLTLDDCIRMFFGEGRVHFLKELSQHGLLPPERSAVANAIHRAFRNGDGRVSERADSIRRAAFQERISSGWTIRQLRSTYADKDLLDAAISEHREVLNALHLKATVDQKLEDANDDLSVGDLQGSTVAATGTREPRRAAARSKSKVDVLTLPGLLAETGLASGPGLLEALRQAGGLAVLAHLLLTAASPGHAHHILGERLRKAGVSKLGDRTRMLNAISAGATAKRIPSLLDFDWATAYRMVLPGEEAQSGGSSGASGEAAKEESTRGVVMGMLAEHHVKAKESYAFAQALMVLVSRIAVHMLAPPDPPRMPSETPKGRDQARSERAEPRLLLLLATHIDSRNRLVKLRRCLLSLLSPPPLPMQPFLDLFIPFSRWVCSLSLVCGIAAEPTPHSEGSAARMNASSCSKALSPRLHGKAENTHTMLAM